MRTKIQLFLWIILMGVLNLSFAAGNVGAGKQKTAACASCHGSDGNSIAPLFPRLAGQHTRYLTNQLTAFKSQSRNNETMQAMTSSLSEQDIENISAYYTQQKPKFSIDDEQYIDEDEEIPVTQELIDQGKKFYRGGNTDTGVSACIACHGVTGLGNEPAGFPVVKGQYAAYVAKALIDFKSGERSNAMMQLIAKKMSPEEFNAVSAYISSMR